LLGCDISDDGLAVLVSAFEEIKAFKTAGLKDNAFSVQGYLALASNLPNVKGLRQGDFLIHLSCRRCWKSFERTLL
jgi:hypothetical protein